MVKIMRISIIDIMVAGLVLWLSAQAWGDTTIEWDDPTTGELSYVGTGQKVGIGTDTPGATLDVRGGGAGGWNESITTRSSAWPNGRASMGNYSGEGMIRVYDSSNTLNVQIPGTTGVGYTYFNAGNVGIGTTSPAVSLHNNGDFITKKPWVDVRAFGAVGDGTTDDRATIQAAIDYAAGFATYYKPPIYLPAGRYKITSALTFKGSSYNNLTMFGTGDMSSIYHTGTGNAIELGGAGVNRADRILLEKFLIEGTISGNAGIYVDNSHRNTFRDLGLHNYSSSINSGAGIKFNWVTIQSVERLYMTGNYNGISGNNQLNNGIEIRDCIIEGNTNAQISFDTGNQISVTGCVMETGTYGIWIYAARAMNFTDNYFENLTTSPIQVENATSVGLVIEGNMFYGGYGQAIYIKGGRGWAVRGNAFYSAATNALIRIKGGAGGPATHGIIDANGVEQSAETGTFFLNDDTTMDDVIVHNPQNGTQAVHFQSGKRFEVNGTGVQIGSTGAIATIKSHLTATATWDPPSISNNASTSTTVTVTGAAAGDVCSASFTGLTTQRMLLSANVSAANTVTVVLHNSNGAAVNLGSGTLRVNVWQY